MVVGDNRITLVQFNCKSIKTKLSEFKVYLYSKKPEILCLAETWVRPGQEPTFIHYVPIWKHRVAGRGGGMCILVRADLVVVPSNLQELAGSRLEVQRVTIKMVNFQLDIMSVYNPGENINVQTFNHYFQQLGEHRIILGDFNAHNRIWSMEGADYNTSGTSLASILMRDDRLCLLTPPKLVTFLSFDNRNHQSTLDLAFLSNNMIMGAILKVGPDLSSDHVPIEVTINHKPVVRVLKRRPKWKLEGVDWKAWSAGLADINYDSDASLNELNRKLVSSLKESTYHIARTSSQYNARFSKPWWNVECSRLTAIRRRTKRLFQRHPKDANYQNWRHAENAAKHYIEEAKRNSWEKFASNINSKMKVKTLFDTVKKINNKFTMKQNILVEGGQIIHEARAKANAFSEHFARSFNSKFTEK